MAKAMSVETRAKKAIDMIRNNSATWERAAEDLDYSVSHIRKIVKEHYKTETGYKKLCNIAKSNKANLKRANAVAFNADPEDLLENTKVATEVVVVETGYLLDNGMASLVEMGLDVYIPAFCIKELEHMVDSYSAAEELLTLYWSTHLITSINLRGHEVLRVDPIIPVKARSKGVVATAVELDSLGLKVRLLTNSREIEELAIQQGCNIDVVRTRKAS